MNSIPVENIGLCARCVHAEFIRSSKGSVFILCGYSKVDSTFPKYPSLPVLQCAAFKAKPAEGLINPQGTS